MLRNLKILQASCLLLIFCIAACDSGTVRKNPPVAQKGVLDLSRWNFQKDGIIELRGEYVFYWNQLLDTRLPDPKEADHSPSYISVPGTWNGHKTDGNPATGHGYATYHLRIVLPGPGQSLALRVNEFQTAATIFVNGRKVYSVGRVSKTPEASKPGLHPEIIKLGPIGTSIDAVFQISNYAHRRGGLAEKIILGTPDQLQHDHLTTIAYNLFILGSILMIGLYYLGIYALRRDQLSSLYFGLFCILIAIRLLTTGERYLLEIIPSIPWEAFYKLEYLSFNLAVPVFVQFIYLLFPDKFSQTVANTATTIGLMFSAIVILLPMRWFSHTLNIYHIFVLVLFAYGIFILVKLAIKKDTSAIIFLAGFLVLFLTTLNDILHSEGFIQTAYIVHFGLFLFIFSQAFLLSLIYAKAFDTIEKQQVNLTRINTSLEMEIQERKQAVEAAEKAIKSSELANRAKSEFLANMSHELRTPLNHIMGFTELLLDQHFGKLNETQDEYLHDVYGSSRHLLSLINDILDLSKIESGKLELELTEFPFEALLDNSTLMFKEKSIKDGIDMSVQLDAIPDLLTGDERKIKQVIYNLLANAVKFTPGGGKVLLKARICPMDGKFSQGIKISVSDTGIGIQPGDLERIFNPFEQLESTTSRRFQGTGLGLSLTKQIVELHGGSIWAESNGPGEGSSFHVIIPRR